jgi:hypothetical protein
MRFALGLIGLMILTATAHAPQPTRHVLDVRNLCDEIHGLLVLETPEILEVQLDGESVKFDQNSSRPMFSRPLTGFDIQVWLLRSDGTAVTQAYRPGHAGAANAGSVTDMMTFTFNRVPSTELAAVVVSVNGNPYIRKIPN